MGNINEIVKRIEQEVEEIPLDRRYWLIRTDSGVYYEDFINENKISIGWNEFSNREFFHNKKAGEEQKAKIEKNYPKKQPSRIYNQIRKFIFDLNIGDVVMIPNENSKFISFGIITSDFYCKDKVQKDEFLKTRDVKWIKTIERKMLDPYLYKMMQAHQTINNADAYSHYIDRSMYSLFNKGDRCYLNIKVGRKGHLPAYDLSKYLDAILDAVEITNDISLEKYKTQYSIEDLDIKVNVQSRGWSLLSGTKELMTKFTAVTNAALYEDIDQLTSDEETNIRNEKIKKIRNGMRKANADLPDDLK